MPKDWFKLSKGKVKGLLTFYISIFIIGLLLSVLSMLFESIELYFNLQFTISAVSIVGGIGTSLLGSSIFYMRKLYKSCINSDFDEPITPTDKIKELGVWVYFFLRPFFAVAFSLMIHITLKACIHIITVTEVKLSVGFVYLTLLLSFFAGFAAGDLITYFESKGKEFAEKAFKNY